MRRCAWRSGRSRRFGNHAFDQQSFHRVVHEQRADGGGDDDDGRHDHVHERRGYDDDRRVDDLFLRQLELEQRDVLTDWRRDLRRHR